MLRPLISVRTNFQLNGNRKSVPRLTKARGRNFFLQQFSFLLYCWWSYIGSHRSTLTHHWVIGVSRLNMEYLEVATYKPFGWHSPFLQQHAPNTLLPDPSWDSFMQPVDLAAIMMHTQPSSTHYPKGKNEKRKKERIERKLLPGNEEVVRPRSEQRSSKDKRKHERTKKKALTSTSASLVMSQPVAWANVWAGRTSRQLLKVSWVEGREELSLHGIGLSFRCHGPGMLQTCMGEQSPLCVSSKSSGSQSASLTNRLRVIWSNRFAFISLSQRCACKQEENVHWEIKDVHHYTFRTKINPGLHDGSRQNRGQKLRPAAKAALVGDVSTALGGPLGFGKLRTKNTSNYIHRTKHMSPTLLQDTPDEKWWQKCPVSKCKTTSMHITEDWQKKVKTHHLFLIRFYTSTTIQSITPDLAQEARTRPHWLFIYLTNNVSKCTGRQRSCAGAKTPLSTLASPNPCQWANTMASTLHRLRRRPWQHHDNSQRQTKMKTTQALHSCYKDEETPQKASEIGCDSCPKIITKFCTSRWRPQSPWSPQSAKNMTGTL